MKRQPRKSPQPPAGWVETLRQRDPSLSLSSGHTLTREFRIRRAQLVIGTYSPETPIPSGPELDVLGRLFRDSAIVAVSKALAVNRDWHWSKRLAFVYQELHVEQDTRKAAEAAHGLTAKPPS